MDWPATRLMAIIAGLLMLQGGHSAAWAQDCRFGQKGYRACVEGRIARMREAEATGAQAGPVARPRRPSAPARARPGTLTPVPSPSWSGVPAPSPRADQRAVQRNQQDFDATMSRLRRQADPAPIMPFPELNPVPGRICPPGGC